MSQPALDHVRESATEPVTPQHRLNPPSVSNSHQAMSTTAPPRGYYTTPPEIDPPLTQPQSARISNMPRPPPLISEQYFNLGNFKLAELEQVLELQMKVRQVSMGIRQLDADLREVERDLRQSQNQSMRQWQGSDGHTSRFSASSGPPPPGPVGYYGPVGGGAPQGQNFRHEGHQGPPYHVGYAHPSAPHVVGEGMPRTESPKRKVSRRE